MSRVFWVRHGPTHEKALVGQRDVPADLSDHAALARLSAALPDGAVVVSSDLIRAAATADAIQGSRVRLPHDPGLREFDFGLWDGMTFDKVAQGWPDLSRRYWEQPGETAPPDGESWNTAAERVNRSVDRLLATHPGQNIIAVAHIGVILTQVQRAMDVSPYAALSHEIDNLSVTEISTQPGWSVSQINHIF